MHITITRSTESPFCLGRLFIDSCYYCDTIEPPYYDADDMRRLASYKKDIGNVAIPYGNYTLDMSTVSPKFGGRSWSKPYHGIVPTVIGVEGRSRILIHPGNTASQYGGDSAGCILVGDYDAHTAMVKNSVAIYHELMRRLTQAHGEIALCINKP